MAPTMDELRAQRDAIRAAEAEEKSRRQWESSDRARTRRDKALIASGIHPATRRPLLSVSMGTERNEKCGDCIHAHRHAHHNRSYWKCDEHRLGMSFSSASDIRKGWPACELWEAS